MILTLEWDCQSEERLQIWVTCLLEEGSVGYSCLPSPAPVVRSCGLGSPLLAAASQTQRETPGKVAHGPDPFGRVLSLIFPSSVFRALKGLLAKTTPAAVGPSAA